MDASQNNVAPATVEPGLFLSQFRNAKTSQRKYRVSARAEERII